MALTTFVARCALCLALCLFAAVPSVPALADCRTGQAQCQRSFTGCETATPTMPSVCACYKKYGDCEKEIGCSPATQESVLDACIARGCDRSACGGPVINNCNATAMGQCAADVSDCASTGINYCRCQVGYVGCLEKLACSATTISSAVISCEAACPTSNCHVNGSVPTVRDS